MEGGGAAGHLLLFCVELEALVQRAAVLLEMLLLLTAHALCIRHHLVLDAAKEAAGHRQTAERNVC